MKSKPVTLCLEETDCYAGGRGQQELSGREGSSSELPNSAFPSSVEVLPPLPSTPSSLDPYFLCPCGRHSSKLVSWAPIFLPFPNHPALCFQTSLGRLFPFPNDSAIEQAMTPYFLLESLPQALRSSIHSPSPALPPQADSSLTVRFSRKSQSLRDSGHDPSDAPAHCSTQVTLVTRRGSPFPRHPQQSIPAPHRLGLLLLLLSRFSRV